MKTTLVLTLSLFFSLSLYSQNIDCQKFKDGDFHYPVEGLRNKMSSRKKKKQKSYNDGKLEMIWKVKWTSDCSYEIYCKKILVKDPKYPNKKGDRMTVNIVNTEEHCYSFTAVYYTKTRPKGIVIPEGQMCFKEGIKEYKIYDRINSKRTKP